MGIFRLPKNQQMVQGFPVNRSYTKAEADNKFTTDLSGYVPYTGATGDVDLGAFDLSVADEAYGAGWNGSLEVPTKNALYDKIEAITFSPAGSDTQVQFNDGGVFGADAGLTYNKTTGTLTVGTGAGILVSHAVRSDASDGLILEANNGTDVGILGAGNTANVTWYGNHNYDAQTANTIASFGASKTLSSLSTATYPSLTELSYVKGVTSAIQTQLNTKGTFTLPSLTTGSVLFSNGSTIAQDNTNLFWDDTNNLLGVGTNAPSTSYRMDIKSASTSLAGLRVYGGGPTGGAAQIGSGEIRLGNGATDFGNIAYNNQSGNVYIDNGYTGGSILLRVGGVSLLGTSNTGATASAVSSSNTGLAVYGGSTLETHLLGGELRLGNSPGENVYLAYGASSGDFYLKNAYAPGKYRFYNGTTQSMTLFGSTGDLSIGTTNDYARLALIKTTEQLRVGYDASNYWSTTVGSTGGVTFDAVGSGASFTFSDNIKLTQTVTTEAVTSDTTVTININGTDYKLLAKA